MKINRIFLTLVSLTTMASPVIAQSYFDDDIYYDASKATKTKTATKKVTQTYTTPSAVIVAEYPSADTYTVKGTRTISVDDYNRRGIFASDSLSNDTTATDFAYTRRIEQFYNPEIVSGSGDKELATIYYMEPERVNVYINTPSAYWGYDYFYPSFSWYSPYWNMSWRWNSPWYWNSWYDPYWAWGPSWGWGWGPAYGPAWGWGASWGPSWGWGGPVYNRPYNPRHQNMRPGHVATNRPSNGAGINGGRPGLNGSNGSTYRPGTTTGNGSYRPGLTNGTTNRNGTVTTNRNGAVNSNRGNSSTTNRNSNSTVTNNRNNSYNTNGGRSSYNSGSFNSGGSRSSGSWGGSSGGGSRSSGGGRGRH